MIIAETEAAAEDDDRVDGGAGARSQRRSNNRVSGTPPTTACPWYIAALTGTSLGSIPSGSKAAGGRRRRDDARWSSRLGRYTRSAPPHPRIREPGSSTPSMIWRHPSSVICWSAGLIAPNVSAPDQAPGPGVDLRDRGAGPWDLKASRGAGRLDPGARSDLFAHRRGSRGRHCPTRNVAGDRSHAHGVFLRLKPARSTYAAGRRRACGSGVRDPGAPKSTPAPIICARWRGAARSASRSADLQKPVATRPISADAIHALLSRGGPTLRTPSGPEGL